MGRIGIEARAQSCVGYFTVCDGDEQKRKTYVPASEQAEEDKWGHARSGFVRLCNNKLWHFLHDDLILKIIIPTCRALYISHAHIYWANTGHRTYILQLAAKAPAGLHRFRWNWFPHPFLILWFHFPHPRTWTGR